MTAREFARALDRLGWNQNAAAQQLGVTQPAVSRWLAGERKVPGPVALLVRHQLERLEQKP